MSDHKLIPGIKLIEGIERLGKVLEYHVEKEYPVDEPTKGEPSAVDVAWFSKKSDRFPLFIFEVESKVTSGMASNTMKVYAQDNKSFEKPLFFFHIVLAGGKLSQKITYIEKSYGTNNYRIYLDGAVNANKLVQDILSQHARIRSDVNYLTLYSLFTSEPWKDKVDYIDLLKHAVMLGLSKSLIIASYIHLARSDKLLIPDLLEIVDKDAEVNFINTGLSSYIGSQWSIPVLCSMNVGLSTTDKDIKKWSSRITNWQNNSSFMPMLVPYLGLSMDYDEFILGCAPQLITLCVGFSARKGSFQPIFIKVLEELIARIDVCWIGLNAAIYLLHISACFELQETYDKASSYLHEFGSISIEDVYNPPSVVSMTEGCYEDYYSKVDRLSLPSLKDFSYLCHKKYNTDSCEIVDIALRVLDEDNYIFEWSKDILCILWSKTVNNGIVS